MHLRKAHSSYSFFDVKINRVLLSNGGWRIELNHRNTVITINRYIHENKISSVHFQSFDRNI